MSLINITIIGGGACGISAFIELFLQLRIAKSHENVSITIIEENQEVGKGLAFGTKQPGHILNTQADLMGIHFTEPQHFSDWLIEHDARIGSEVVDNQGENKAFTTRRLYGDYLKEQFEHYFELAKKEGMRVEVIRASAIKIAKMTAGFDVHLSGNKKHACNYLVLAPGTPVANNYPELEDNKHYFGSPWPSTPLLENIPKDADVAILGSSLSAIDALMTLADNAYTGKITCYSLDGLMPRVQSDEHERIECKFLTLKKLHEIQRNELRNPTIKEIFRLFIQEAEAYADGAIDWKATKRMGKPADQLLAEDIEIARKGGDALVNIPYSLRYESSEMWKWLDESEKLKFKKWLGPYWAVNRHCMPLVNAERVRKLFETKQLSVVPRLKEVVFDENKNGFVLTCEDGQESVEKYLINATGPASSVKMMKSELMQNLAKDNLIEAENAGGIKINTETMQVIAGKKAYPNFYAVGHITNGLLLDVNAVWFNVKMIGNLSRHLISQIIGNPS
ncbi:FAD/NAD(P)-binding protein [Dyadobacter chenwenxiniae]|uniref:FAD/NAD(P)-binding protein n=1 Tax=Dyadobacter chenwenxiniae TaxID=2906456 RepID=A0A9X1PPT9_9BACT|nr:FAD/NAD(P)-binding protein [Dyadobacter chenwenxiniae]MCF0065237.1 FAD/NAD(P)-binding protein [Dyadobacter chenwenxiniae]UON84493.1 FAD/NAD(P)-binding protein [Dyadobacter chenwenxiniae]